MGKTLISYNGWGHNNDWGHNIKANSSKQLMISIIKVKMEYTFLFVVLVAYLSAINNKVTSLEVENIIHGSNAEKGQFPYSVEIAIHSTTYPIHLCGGTLIAPNIVLTAAHCFYDNKVQKIKHKPYILYDQSSNKYDIAVLRLKKSFDVGDYSLIKTISLPERNQNYEDKLATLSGFGKDDVTKVFNRGNLSNSFQFAWSGRLKYTIVKILNSVWCSGTLHQFCGVMKRTSNGDYTTACYGDSGSPLVYNDTVIGIVSYGNTDSCGESQIETFTNVSYFIDFIIGAIIDEPTNDMSITSVNEY
ncbi:chymotrypsin-2-like [Copidosoma floridanum]|uniref:chymotrypsin-2-like n=1 Tax=Copidosoma floridanum TaxID=29053 RepID=UPI0006C94ACC|nr:chymotrypsin-2-like [Copidosoma floridanum]